jgi:hypothetical protein
MKRMLDDIMLKNRSNFKKGSLDISTHVKILFSKQLARLIVEKKESAVDVVYEKESRETYHFHSDDLKKVIDDLRKFNVANLGYDVVLTHYADVEDHEYTPNDYIEEDAQFGRINGSIRIEKGILDIGDIFFVPLGEGIKTRQDGKYRSYSLEIQKYISERLLGN